MKFELIQTDKNSSARAGSIETDHGHMKTPVFMPVGTCGSVKAVQQQELEEVIDAPIILGNTYHLFLRPGCALIEQAGGLHKFMNWDRNILTDSGGYQVYSLGKTRKITEEGVRFKSHIDGSACFISPESAIDIQRQIGADIIMAFDECTPYPCTHEYARKSLQMTLRWLERCGDRMKKSHSLYGHGQSLFPIVQGSTYKDLRMISVQETIKFEADGYAIGGLSVGEPEEELYDMTQLVCEQLPEEKPRYLMGVGTPVNIISCISRGIDMFDCVMPTRNARHGLLFTWNGQINIKNAKWKTALEPIDVQSNSFLSQSHSRAYLRHSFYVKRNIRPSDSLYTQLMLLP